MLENILNLSQQLIKIKTDPDNIPELNKALELIKANLTEFTIEEFEKNDYKSILVYTQKTRPTKFKIILNGHLDVIPGKDHQYNPAIKDGKLYGVGSMDMKSNLSSLLFAFKEMASKVEYPLGLQIVTDEEVGGFNCTKYQIERGVNAEFVIASEPTNLNIVNQAKGIFQFEAEFKGVTSHGAYPWKGVNALEVCNQFINNLKILFPNPQQEMWCTTTNIARIETTNQSYNKIPDNCKIAVDIRCIPEDLKTIASNIENILPADSILRIVENENVLYTPIDNKYLQQIQKSTKKVAGIDNRVYSANGSSDSRHYSDIGSFGVEFGPIGGGIGEDVEWVDINSLQTYYEIICDFLKQSESL